MTEIGSINYSQWTNSQAARIAKRADTDGVKGLQGKEIFNFVQSAIASDINKTELNELLGVSISKTRAESKALAREKTPEFEKAIKYYNDEMNANQRYSVTRKTSDILEEKLYKIESDINIAYQNCAAFNDPDIMVVVHSPYRYWTYPRFRDRLINFDIEEIRTRTTKDMDSLNEVKEKVEAIMAAANGETEYDKPAKTEYDVDAIAAKHLGMSYSEFAKKYSAELEKCKYVTYGDIGLMDETMAFVYGRAKAYAAEMLELTIQEAHNVHWDIQERKLYDSLEAAGDLYAISDFEYDGITDEGLAQINTGIMYKSFEEALIDKYNELKPADNPDPPKEPDAVIPPTTDTQPKGPEKRIVNGAILIFNPDGSIYDLNGKRIK